MRTQVIKVTWHDAQYKVIHDDGVKVDPFRINYYWLEPTEYGMWKRQKQVAKYADLPSCLFYLYEVISKSEMSEGTVIKEALKRR